MSAVIPVGLLCNYRLLRAIDVCVFFFFQAEDGIRDLVRSRGLGDVYKRQGLLAGALVVVRSVRFQVSAGRPREPRRRPHVAGQLKLGTEPVSYTHLTLPTSDLV